MKKDRPAWVDMPLQLPTESDLQLKEHMLNLLDSGNISLENTKLAFSEIKGIELDDEGARRAIRKTLIDAIYSEERTPNNAWVDTPLFGIPKKG